MAELHMGEVAKVLEGPAYVTVGVGVLVFQRAQVYRREVERALGRRLTDLGDRAQRLGHDVDERVAPARRAVADAASEAVQHLPEPARDLVDAVGNLFLELPSEAKALAKEAVALGRFALQVAGAPASRYVSRQGT
jgi:hypothetical protein